MLRLAETHITERWRYWGTMFTVNIVGTVLVLISAASSAAIQVLGFALLLPGSVCAALLPLQRLWVPSLWNCCQTDAAGFANALFIPTAVAINSLVWVLFRAYRLKNIRTVR